MKIIDISWTLSGKMTGYKNRHEKKAAIRQTRNYARDGVNETQITLSSHSGTHVDAPLHFMKNGKSIDKMKVDAFVGPCRVVDFGKLNKITADDFRKAKIAKGGIILCKTRNSRRSETANFDQNFVYVDKSGAKYLAGKKAKAVGIDYLGIENKQPGHETHKMLLGKNVGIIEGLRLGHVKPGKYMLVCLPLRIRGTEAAPARAILLR